MPTNPEIYVTSEQSISEDAVKILATDLSDALGQNRLLDFAGKGGVVLEPKSEYFLLSDQLPRTESVLSVHLCTPYYGQGYERGYWPEIVATLEFLRHRLPGARVWYGHSVSDDIAEATPEFLQQLWNYWAHHGHRPYDKRR